MLNPSQWTRIVTQRTIVIHSRACVLGNININTAAASAVLTVYDNTNPTGDIVAIVDCSQTNKNTNIYGIALANGLTITLSGGNADVTITHEGPGA